VIEVTARNDVGARPADLPGEELMRFDSMINLKVAEALGLTILQHVLLQATEVIQ
jgi:ABC-type uncharacterized transport system substrate-binding protein